MNSSVAGTIAVPPGDPVGCRGVDKGNVEVPGLWPVMGGGVSLEESSGACVVGLPGITGKSELATGLGLLGNLAEWLSVICAGVAIGWPGLAALAVVEAGGSSEVVKGTGVGEEAAVVIWSLS